MKKTFLILISAFTLLSTTFMSCNQNESVNPTFEAFGQWNVDSIYSPTDSTNYFDNNTYEKWSISENVIYRSFAQTSSIDTLDIYSYNVNNSTINIEYPFNTCNVDTFNLSNNKVKLVLTLADSSKYYFTNI